MYIIALCLSLSFFKLEEILLRINYFSLSLSLSLSFSLSKTHKNTIQRRVAKISIYDYDVHVLSFGIHKGVSCLAERAVPSGVANHFFAVRAPDTGNEDYEERKNKPSRATRRRYQ